MCGLTRSGVDGCWTRGLLHQRWALDRHSWSHWIWAKAISCCIEDSGTSTTLIPVGGRNIFLTILTGEAFGRSMLEFHVLHLGSVRVVDVCFFAHFLPITSRWTYHQHCTLNACLSGASGQHTGYSASRHWSQPWKSSWPVAGITILYRRTSFSKTASRASGVGPGS